jgi:2-C-methyl-D-erythritol 2,4-cyclodiphosphate synthase
MGRHFPDTDPEFKDISSLLLLAQVMQMISDQGFKAVNIDAVIIAQQPRMSAHMPRMIEAIRRTPGLEGTAVNLKATTTEGLGFTGRKEGIAAQAVTLLRHMQT